MQVRRSAKSREFMDGSQMEDPQTGEPGSSDIPPTGPPSSLMNGHCNGPSTAPVYELVSDADEDGVDVAIGEEQVMSAFDLTTKSTAKGSGNNRDPPLDMLDLDVSTGTDFNDLLDGDLSSEVLLKANLLSCSTSPLLTEPTLQLHEETGIVSANDVGPLGRDSTDVQDERADGGQSGGMVIVSQLQDMQNSVKKLRDRSR